MVELTLSYNPSLRPWGQYGTRMGIYLGISLGLFFLPFPWIGLPLSGTFFLGLRSGIRWASWLRGLSGFWFFILLGPLVAWPQIPGGGNSLLFWQTWAPAWIRAGAFLGLLAASHWLAATTTLLEIRSGLNWVLFPLGPAARRILSLLGSLSLSFLPWTGAQVKGVGEALALRGVDKKKHPLKWILALGMPLTLGLLEKARHTAEALALRSPDLGDTLE